MITIFFLALMLLVSMLTIYRLHSLGVGDIAFFSAVIKVILCTVGLYVILPFGGADAQVFERRAWEWSQGTLLDAVGTIDVSASYVISSLTAIIYNLLERNVSIPIYINGILGLLIFYYGVVLLKTVWPETPLGRTSLFLMALSPMLNINSAVTLRENYIVLFSILAAIQLAKYARSGAYRFVFSFLFFVLLAAFFHGGMILLSLGLPLFILYSNKNIGMVNKVVTGCLFAGAFVLIINSMEFGKLRDVQKEGVTVELLAETEANRREAGTAYLVGLEPTGIHDIIWQAPIRSFFLLAKPFPWDVRSFGHFVVFLDAVVWWAILWLLWKNRRSIKDNPAALALLFSCAVTIVAFAYGTGNFGTGVRHRTKFLVMALVIVSPFLPRFAFGKRFKYSVND